MKPLRLAIAEDNWFVAEHLRAELIAFGHTVVGLARMGEELIELVARERPDLALVDFRLAGGSDGLAAAREIEGRFCGAGHRLDRSACGGRGQGSRPPGLPGQALHLVRAASDARGRRGLAEDGDSSVVPHRLIPPARTRPALWRPGGQEKGRAYARPSIRMPAVGPEALMPSAGPRA
jgi:hypothetical protein